MHRLTVLAAFVGVIALGAPGTGEDPLVAPAHHLQAGDPAWQDLLTAFARRPFATADFQELRWFPFRKSPVVLKGEVRVSAERGLSLHYTDPEERVVILDGRGMLVRQVSGDRVQPADPRSGAANDAMLHILHFDFAALEPVFELYGRREGATWSLALVPRDDSLRRTLGQISVAGEDAAVRHIELRRSATQRVEILIQPPRSTTAFTDEEIRRFFR